MKLARVVGTVVSTFNAPIFDERTLLVCDLLAPDGTPAGGYMIAVDTVGAGPGETVLLLDEGSSARQILGVRKGPVRTLVVGIVDAVTLVPSEARGSAAAAADATKAARPAARGPRKPAAKTAKTANAAKAAPPTASTPASAPPKRRPRPPRAG
jgi:ethanolamine utilization protein EutN